MKRKLISILSNNRYINDLFAGNATIFTLHRVHPFESDKLQPNENMKVTPQFLEKFILELQLNGYEFISLNSLHEILKNNIPVRKKIVFTLDDGYKDNYDFAYPVFKKYNIPFTIYVTTSFPERTANLWWYTIEDLIINNDKIVLSNGISLSCKDEIEKTESFLKLRNYILSLKRENFNEELNDLLKSYNIDWFAKCSVLAMSWEEINHLSKDELVTIGGHTKNHYKLKELSSTIIEDEILGANKLIEEKINRPVLHFAYPFGGKQEIKKRESDIVKGFGFQTCTTTRIGNIYMKHRNYLECLPRIMLTENFNIKDIGRIRRKLYMTI